jgi:hypothetical protein
MDYNEIYQAALKKSCEDTMNGYAKRLAESANAERERADASTRRAAFKAEMAKGDFNLTDYLQAKSDAETPPPAKDAELIKLCRVANPFTRAYFNLTAQVMLRKTSPAVAVELENAAQYESVDFARANPALADADRSKAAAAIVNALKGEAASIAKIMADAACV